MDFLQHVEKGEDKLAIVNEYVYYNETWMELQKKTWLALLHHGPKGLFWLQEDFMEFPIPFLYIFTRKEAKRLMSQELLNFLY